MFNASQDRVRNTSPHDRQTRAPKAYFHAHRSGNNEECVWVERHYFAGPAAVSHIPHISSG